MKIALIQCNPLTGALEKNMEAIVAATAAAAKSGAELCVTPELALCGRNAGDLMLQNGFVESCGDVLQQVAKQLAMLPDAPPLVIGAPIANPVPQGKALQSCAVLLHEGKARVLGRKVLVPSTGPHRDARYFEPGVACGILQHKGWRIAVTVGEDIWNDRTFWQGQRTYTTDPVADFIAAGGADGLINLGGLPFEQGMPALYRNMLRHLAAHYRIPVASANLVGGNDSLVYFGGSLAFDGKGAVLAKAPAFEEDVLIVDMSGKSKSRIADDLGEEETLWRAIVTGTRDFAKKCGFSKAMLGLSGGVDSALVAAIAAEAFGPKNVTCYLMPSAYSSKGSIDDSLALAERLGLATHTLPISGVLEAYAATFGAAFPETGLAGTAEENMQARIRGALLMAGSNSFGALLLATGNKSEAAVGYSTLYGDLTGGIAPISDIYKRQVYALCHWYNERCGREVIPECILTKAPSAELRPGQKDSDSLPPYDVLDDILYEVIENGADFSALEGNGFDPDVSREVLRLVRRAEFKRRQAPPALHLSRRSFALGWNMPIARE